ncbi:unnamed protein product, partial [Mesorhabditis belari]|uniref:Uncharacterized protein n=1 Tax=Mesorhabditis belari TaxID=2138241 RepID=A0AAF3FL25_9BILA
MEVARQRVDVRPLTNGGPPRKTQPLLPTRSLSPRKTIQEEVQPSTSEIWEKKEDLGKLSKKVARKKENGDIGVILRVPTEEEIPKLPQNGALRNHLRIPNGDVDNSRKETVHTYDFGDDPMPPDTCCCGKFFILRGCRFVAIISLISVLANTVLYAFGFTRFGVSAWIEIGVLVLEFLTIFMLFCGLARKRSGFLKPYLFFNTIWAICLCILFIMCLWQLIRGGNLSANLWRNLKALKSQSDQERIRDVYRKKEDINAALLGMATATAMTALASLIVVDFLFVQIVYRTFHYLAYKEDKAKEDNVGSQNC